MKMSRTLVGVVGASLALVALSASPGQVAQARSGAHTLPGGYQHLVVIYEENHSFDNLYGTLGPGRRRPGGRPRAGAPAQRTQVAQDGTAYRCLLQNDVNLASPPLAATCADAGARGPGQPLHQPAVPDRPLHRARRTRPARRRASSPPTACSKNSPGALPGGCTRDLVHRFYQEQYQLDGGKQDRYVTGSDAVGLTMGHYDTQQLPIYRYLHCKGAPHYVLADHFFQAAFGGSFLNHQCLIAARAPAGHRARPPDGAANSVLDRNGMPEHDYPLYKPTSRRVKTAQLTQTCADGDAVGPRRRPAATSRSTPCSRRSPPSGTGPRSRSSTTRSTPTSATG